MTITRDELFSYIEDDEVDCIECEVSRASGRTLHKKLWRVGGRYLCYSYMEGEEALFPTYDSLLEKTIIGSAIDDGELVILDIVYVNS